MNEKEKQGRIARFLEDKNTANLVKEVLLSVFLKPREKSDVQTLAAERLSINLLHEGWKELERYKSSLEEKPEELKQIGM